MDKQKEIKSARAIKNGIIFFSNAVPYMATKVYYDENENIKATPISFNEVYKEDLEVKKKIQICNTMSLLDITFIFFAFILSLIYNNLTFLFIAFLNCWFQIFNFVYGIFEIVSLKTGDGGVKARFHAAEHKVLNAYRKKQGIPNYKEVEEASKFSKYCGSMLMINRIFSKISFLVLAIILFINSSKIYNNITSWFNRDSYTGNDWLYNIAIWTVIVSIMFIIVLLYQIICIIVKDTGILKFMQVFFTNEPGEREIKLAIKGIKYYEIYEKYYERFAMEKVFLKQLYKENGS